MTLPGGSASLRSPSSPAISENKDCRSQVARYLRPVRATSQVRSSQGDAQSQPRGAAALHQPGDLVPVEVVGVDLGQRPGDAEPGEPVHPPGVHEQLFLVEALYVVMIGSSHQIPELIDHSCNESSVMITMLSRAGPAGSGHRRSAGQRTSE